MSNFGAHQYGPYYPKALSLIQHSLYVSALKGLLVERILFGIIVGITSGVSFAKGYSQGMAKEVKMAPAMVQSKLYNVHQKQIEHWLHCHGPFVLTFLTIL